MAQRWEGEVGTGFGNAGYGFVSFQHLREYANDAVAISAPPWHP
ncbi:MAG TPA: hypothetical protein VGZ23_12390 [bacterium]|nr:hypothetical protein [bacterium]